MNGKVSPDYLNESAKFLAPIKQKSYEKMQIAKGDYVLDVGCGSGIDVMAMGRIVSSSGSVLGVDHDENMLKLAEYQAKNQGLSDFVKFRQCVASTLPFVDNYFSSCRSERLFMHLSKPQDALAEMYRVTKPGGRIVIIDSDWGSLSIDCQATKTEQLLAIFRREKILTNGYSGRSLYRLFKQYNFSKIEIDVIPVFTNNLELFYTLSLQEAVENRALENNVISNNLFTNILINRKYEKINSDN